MIKQREYGLIARSYAEALFRAGRTQGNTAQLKQQSVVLEAVIADHNRLLTFFDNPQIATEDKEGLIERVFTPRFDPLLIRLLGMLVRRDRTVHLAPILERFRELVEQADGVYPAAVASPRELPDDEKQRLQQALESFTGYRLNVEFHVDPDLIGGIVFRFRDLLIDGSLSSALHELRRRLADTQILGRT